MVLVTGASGEIGEFLFNEYKNFGEAVRGISCRKEVAGLDRVNISSFNSVQAWVQACELRGEVTLLNCAGINYNSLLRSSEPEDWANVINTNLIGTYNVIRAVLPYMTKVGYGRIINFSSVVPQIGVPGTTAYAASKAGLWGMTKSLSKELGDKNITVNNINLGYCEIGMIKEVPLSALEKLRSGIPKKRFCTKEEILKTVDYIRGNAYLNGTSIDLNGGLF